MHPGALESIARLGVPLCTPSAPQVLQVVREQITRTLSLKPTSLELFKTRVNVLNYSEILKLRQTERLHQEETLAVPVLVLRERLKPELLELIRQQRLLRLCEGTLFRKISSRRRQDKLWYCRLSPNHKVLHYGDVEEGVPSCHFQQHLYVPVADMKALLVGKECPHTKEKSSGKQNKVSTSPYPSRSWRLGPRCSQPRQGQGRRGTVKEVWGGRNSAQGCSGHVG
uniref:Engulfment and cell motility 3 n=1 Tax=Nothoprocta perdicaria TaxID=30464 RepID=A0A8C7EH68_NOTPE